MLSGINRKCKKCTEKCKQWKEVTVVVCPNYNSAFPTQARMARINPKAG